MAAGSGAGAVHACADEPLDDGHADDGARTHVRDGGDALHGGACVSYDAHDDGRVADGVARGGGYEREHGYGHGHTAERWRFARTEGGREMGGCHLITMGRLFIPFLLFNRFFYLPLLFHCRALSGVDLNVCWPPIFRASNRTNLLVCMNGRFDAACLNVHLYLHARTGHVRPLCLQLRRLACSASKLPVFLWPLAHYNRHIPFHPPNTHYSTDGPLHTRTPTLIIFPPASSCALSLVIHVIVTSTYTGPL